MTELLLKHGADAHTKSDDGGCGCCHSDAVPRLRRDSPFGRRETPLHWASEQGHAAVVELLLAHGAHVHARDGGGCGARSPFGHGWRCAAAAEISRASAEPGQRRAYSLSLHWSERVGLGYAVTHSAALTCDAADL